MSNKKRIFRDLLNKIQAYRLKRIKSKLKFKNKELKLKTEYQMNTHSILWVWEFSKKAVLICFLFYVIVQIYSMVVMVRYYDFTYLGDLINQTGNILQNCVFAYLIKAGIENVGKILFQDEENDEHDDGSVG